MQLLGYALYTSQERILPPKFPIPRAERTSSEIGPSLVRGHTVSVFVKIYGEIILYKLYRKYISRHLCCVTGQTVRSQNITYYGIPASRRQKRYVPTLDLELSRVTARSTRRSFER